MSISKFPKWPVLVSMLLVIGGIGSNWSIYSWRQWQPASCMPDNCFCESIRGGLVAQPANTWSCFAFVLVGLLIMGRAQQDIANAAQQQEPANRIRGAAAYSRVYGGSLVIIGLGSAFFHASLSLVGQFLDVTGMYLLASFILLYNLSRLISLNPRVFVVSYVVLNLLLIEVLWLWPELRRYVFGAMIIIALIIEHGIRKKNQVIMNIVSLQRALLVMAIGFLIWILDITKTLCNPVSLLQGHAVWHILGAMAAGYLYQYYRSENVSNRTELL